MVSRRALGSTWVRVGSKTLPWGGDEMAFNQHLGDFWRDLGPFKIQGGAQNDQIPFLFV